MTNAHRVLIVDDERPVVEFVDRILRAAGYDTAVALDGRVGIRHRRKPLV